MYSYDMDRDTDIGLAFCAWIHRSKVFEKQKSYVWTEQVQIFFLIIVL
jgi:hypothetical protein